MRRCWRQRWKDTFKFEWAKQSWRNAKLDSCTLLPIVNVEGEKQPKIVKQTSFVVLFGFFVVWVGKLLLLLLLLLLRPPSPLKHCVIYEAATIRRSLDVVQQPPTKVRRKRSASGIWRHLRFLWSVGRVLFNLRRQLEFLCVFAGQLERSVAAKTCTTLLSVQLTRRRKQL